MCHRISRSTRGLALIMVLWVTAALSIAVASLSYMVKGELRHVSALREGANVRAEGRAVMILLLQELVAAGQRRLDRPVARTMVFNGRQIALEFSPLNGWIDINRASPELLMKALESAAGLDVARAQALVTAVVEARTARTSTGQSALFDVPEDLLQVPGMDYEVYARLAPLITASAGGDGKVNPYAAPPAVLAILAAGGSTTVPAFVAAREKGAADISGLNSAFVSPLGSSQLKLSARVVDADGNFSVVNCEASLASRSTDAVPWSIRRCGYQKYSPGGK